MFCQSIHLVGVVRKVDNGSLHGPEQLVRVAALLLSLSQLLKLMAARKITLSAAP
jgi:hypothetical protein